MKNEQKWYQNWFWHGFFRSNYITAAWNWFLMLAGKAAEAVLTFSVVYSCARLLPSVQTPVVWDNGVFVAQMVALDVGGLSLRKMANQARKDGNESGATFASRVSTALIIIMVVNVALSVIQRIANIDANVIAGVEGVLLVARAVMAVLYAHVIHSLKSDASEGEKQAEQAAQDQAKQMLDAFAAQMDERFTAITEMIQPVSYDALVEQLNARITEQMKQMEPPTKQSVSQPEPVSPKHETPKRKPVSQSARNIVTLPPRESGQNTRDVIHALLREDETRGPRELGRLANVAPATAKRHRDAYFAEHAEQSETPDVKQSAM